MHDVLQAVIEREPAARTSFLDDACRDDPGLRTEVVSLLERGLAPGRFDALVERYTAPDTLEPALPERVGAYRPIRLIARGGMGTVLLAERALGDFDQRVAIKLLPTGTVADLRSRFLAERRILARLQHPNIARLLDGGTTDDGRPYLVMELVEGEPLTEFCDRQRLSVAERLRLFLDVCAAVTYAHANLIVHRDIKPANVLVSAPAPDSDRPVVKLLDFGISKLLDDDAGSPRPPRTRPGLRLMTPDYAAPEQVRGEPVTTATDVYQLGVLLYELLSGRRPHRVSSLVGHHVERVVCDEIPPRPSQAVARQPGGDIGRARATTSERLGRRLAGDLDTIVLRALTKEPERRYPSVDALAEDIRRHVDGRPVKARPDTLAYRARKFVGRNMLAVAAASAVGLLVATLVVSTAMQNGRVARERDRAEQAASFLIDLFEDLEPVQARGSTVPARDILDRSVVRVRSELADDPLLQARLLGALGGVYQLRGHFAQAEPLLREATSLRVEHLDADHPDIADSRYALADLLAETGRHAEGEELLASALDVYRDTYGSRDPRVAAVRMDIALARRAAGDLAGADTLLSGAVDLLRSSTASREDLATALLYLGKVRLEQGDMIGAEPLIEEALSLRRELFGEDHPTVANAIDGLGELSFARADFDGAERAFRHALSIRRRLFPDDHTDVAVSLENLGITLRRQGRTEEADRLLRDALDVLRPELGDEHPLVVVALAHRDSLGLGASAP
jgi:serine/threonine-protein kinase